MIAETDFDKVVYFVRHGESTGNVSPVYQSNDSALTERGSEQAVRIAGRAVNLEFDALLASPFQRAKDTALAIAKATGKEVEYSEVFVERIKPSGLVGKAGADVSELKELYERSLYAPGVRAEDGENFDDLLGRADKALDLLKNRPEKSLMVVTHGYFLRVMVARVLLGKYITGESLKSFQTSILSENTGLTVLKLGTTWEGEKVWKLWVYNDHAHLG